MNQTQRRTDLRNLHTYYTQFYVEQSEAPTRLEDLEQLADYKTYHSSAPGTWERLADGRYEIVWGAEIDDRPEGAAGVKLAWEKEPWPNGSRMVLDGGGNIRELGQAEFDALPSARGRAEKEGANPAP
jgi:hypothetical protein